MIKIIKKCRKLEKSLLSSFIKEAKEALDPHESRRTQAVFLMDGGNCLDFMESLMGFKKRPVFKYRAQFLKERRLLSKDQRDEILTFLTTTTPKEHRYEADFWNTSVLAHLIQEKCGVICKVQETFLSFI